METTTEPKISRRIKYDMAYQYRARANPGMRPCDCGRRADVYRSSGFVCQRCADMETAARKFDLLGCRSLAIVPKRGSVPQGKTNAEEKWERYAGEWETHDGPGWGTLAVLEAALANIETKFATETQSKAANGNLAALCALCASVANQKKP